VADREKEAIFGKFTRGEVARTMVNRGTGLGLAIVREVVRVHGGRAGVEDRPGGGSSFYVRVPAGEQP
jgi:signal transduction histidine kinase